MAVHHFTAPDVVVTRGWQPIDTFPRDGTTVEVQDGKGNISTAVWNVNTGRIDLAAGADIPINWRNPE